jgi:Secretion system C-terminal sorting domain
MIIILTPYRHRFSLLMLNYYIDDVCVSTDSLYNDTWTGIYQTENAQNVITIFPNPSTGFFSIESPIPIQSYGLYNIHGQAISNIEIKNTYSALIDLSTQSKGIYVLRIYTKSNTSTHKIILTY